MVEFLSSQDFFFVSLTKKIDPFTDSTKYQISIMPSEISLIFLFEACYNPERFFELGTERILVAESLGEKYFVGIERTIPIQELPQGTKSPQCLIL
jgi:hypothetical protein